MDQPFVVINITALFFGLASLTLTASLFRNTKHICLKYYIPIQTLLLLRQILYILRLGNPRVPQYQENIIWFLIADFVMLFLLIVLINRLITLFFKLNSKKVFLWTNCLTGIYYAYGAVTLLIFGLPEGYQWNPPQLWTIIPNAAILYGAVIILFKSHGYYDTPRIKKRLLFIGGILSLFTAAIVCYDLNLIPKWHFMGLGIFPLILFFWSFASITLLTEIFFFHKNDSASPGNSDLIKHYGLSPRENEIAQKIALGKTYKQTGEELFISIGTVKTHMFKIYKKMGITNKIALIRIMKGHEKSES